VVARQPRKARQIDGTRVAGDEREPSLLGQHRRDLDAVSGADAARALYSSSLVMYRCSSTRNASFRTATMTTKLAQDCFITRCGRGCRILAPASQTTTAGTRQEPTAPGGLVANLTRARVLD
jgi:hypothetical protein